MIVLLLRGRESQSLIKNDGGLLLPLLFRFRDRRYELSRPSMVDYFLRGLALGIEFPLRSGQLYGKFRIGLSKNRLPLVMRSHLSFEKRFSAHKTRPNPNGLVQTF